MDIAIYPLVNEECELPFGVKGIGSQLKQCHIERKEGYQLHQIIFCKKGKGVLKLHQKEYELIEGSYFYLKPNEPHEYYNLTESWSTDWILFTGDHIDNVLSHLGFETSKIGYFHNNSNIKSLFQNIMTTMKSIDFLRDLNSSQLLYKLFIELYRMSEQEPTSLHTPDKFIIDPIIHYINDHFSDYITLEVLAEILTITPQHLCKLFKNQLYMRPFEYITKRRIQESKKLLICSNKTIKEIGKTVGYQDSSYFCAMFKKYELTTPMQFRYAEKR
mgnify:CR=1 FL=1